MSVELTAEILRELVEYDPETGLFTWRKRDAKWFASTARRTQAHTAANWNSKFEGKFAFTANSRRYRSGAIFNKVYFAHRLAWLYVYGRWPERHIDHMNGNESDNRICNLREVDESQNLRNRGKPSSNTSGFKGVSYMKNRGNWRAVIQVRGRYISLGYFSRPEDAHDAYRKAADRLHGEYKNYG